MTSQLTAHSHLNPSRFPPVESYPPYNCCCQWSCCAVSSRVSTATSAVAAVVPPKLSLTILTCTPKLEGCRRQALKREQTRNLRPRGPALRGVVSNSPTVAKLCRMRRIGVKSWIRTPSRVSPGAGAKRPLPPPVSFFLLHPSSPPPNPQNFKNGAHSTILNRHHQGELDSANHQGIY